MSIASLVTRMPLPCSLLERIYTRYQQADIACRKESKLRILSTNMALQNRPIVGVRCPPKTSMAFVLQAQLPREVQGHERIAAQLAGAMAVVEAAIDNRALPTYGVAGGRDAYAAAAASNAVPAGPSASRWGGGTVAQAPAEPTLRQMVELYAEQSNLDFVPKAGRREQGLQVCRQSHNVTQWSLDHEGSDLEREWQRSLALLCSSSLWVFQGFHRATHLLVTDILQCEMQWLSKALDHLMHSNRWRLQVYGFGLVSIILDNLHNTIKFQGRDGIWKASTLEELVEESRRRAIEKTTV